MARLIHRLRRTMHSPISLLIALGLLLVGWQTVVGTIPLVGQWIVFATLLLGAGIPHGALDHLISRETALRSGKRFSWTWFFIRYLALMLLYSIAWFIVPSASLIIFLVVSAWHFGETDIEHVPSTASWIVTRFMVGSFVIAFILLTHPTEVTPILERITHHHPQVLSVWQRVTQYSTSVWQSWALVTVCLFGVSVQLKPVGMNWPRLGRLTVILALGYWLPLLLAFGLYFGGWHALNSFQSISAYLRQGRRIASTDQQIWLKSLPFTGLALISLGVFVWWWQRSAHDWDPLPLLFVFLSVITLPHLDVFHGMHNQIDGQVNAT
ncbi:Brp/Blh family beta-carotene 15,15'-dioxygenase [Spirosoma soli]|uniref:Probable beta-carotene 15,15'-dioxygenase n=1 Tax=Spirosoma soli TaxID=1770529 RepID=A0ABW5M8P0_9BACT